MAKKIIYPAAALALLLTLSYGATDAFYRHHERSSTTSLEADLVAREIGIDGSARNSLIAKKANAGLIHLISKEMDTASLSGVLNLTGTFNASSTVKLANYTSGRVPYFTTGGLITDASTFTYNGTTLGVNSLTNSALAGTGTRVATSTSAGLMGNATTIAGANTWSDAQTFAAATLVEYSNPGGTTNLRVGNLSNTASSMARLNLQVAGAIADDPIIRWDVSGVTSWTAGVDNSVVGDPFVIAASGSLGSSNVMSITTAGAVSLPGTLSVGGNEAFDYDEGTFVATYSGGGTSPTGTASYVRIGKAVTLILPALSATSNAITFAYTGLPAGIQPTTTQTFGIYSVKNNGTDYYASTILSAVVSASGTITFKFGDSANGWTASGAKAINYPITITYTLQ